MMLSMTVIVLLLFLIHGFALSVRRIRQSPSFKLSKKIPEGCQTLAISTPPSSSETVQPLRRKSLMKQLMSIRSTSSVGIIPSKTDPSVPWVETIVRAADGHKAIDIKVLHVEEITTIASYLVIASGASAPQLSAISMAVEKDLNRDFKVTPRSREGKGASGWVLLDFGDIIVHIMTPAMRDFYKLEKRWKVARVLDIDHLLSSGRNLGTIPDKESVIRDSTDPFWS